jgi:predicted N-formylglutamate amidohydrolase
MMPALPVPFSLRWPASRQPQAGCVVLISCEHAGNRIPAAYRALFGGAGAVLRSHRGYDPGALGVARELAETLAAPLIVSTVSRLLIELNRSPRHPRLYSEFTRGLPPAQRRQLLEQVYLPYRARIEALVADAVAQGRRVLHVSSHSFTPVLDGEERQTDIGLLYDPGRDAERVFCRRWRATLQAAAPACRIRLNYPYSGKSDGLTTWLRRRFGAEHYAGIELEINQKHAQAGGRRWRELRAAVAASLRLALAREIAPDTPVQP